MMRAPSRTTPPSPDGHGTKERASSRLVPAARRRSLPMVALGVLLVVGCALAFAASWIRLGAREPVLVLARSVPVGHLLAPGDLRATSLPAGTDLPVVPAAEEQGILGRPLAVPVAAGSLLAPADLSSSAVPPAGEAVVGLALKAGQYPAGVGPGASVWVLQTAQGSGGASSSTLAGGQVTATVVAVQAAPPSSDAAAVVSLELPATEAVAVAGQAASGQVSLVLVHPGGGP